MAIVIAMVAAAAENPPTRHHEVETPTGKDERDETKNQKPKTKNSAPCLCGEGLRSRSIQRPLTKKTRANARVLEVRVRLTYEAVFSSAVSRLVEACMALSYAALEVFEQPVFS